MIQKNKNEEKKNKKIDLVVGELQEKNEIIRTERNSEYSVWIPMDRFSKTT